MRSKLPSGDITKPTDLPDDFDGWVRADGSMISQAMFPEATALFKRTPDYPGRRVDDANKLISVPNMT